MRVEKDHDLSDDLLRSPGFDHALLAFGANAVKVGQAFRCLLNNIKDLFLEGMDEFFGKVRANPFDHP